MSVMQSRQFCSTTRLLTLAVLTLLPHFPAEAQLNPTQPEQLQGVGIDEKLGSNVPLDLTFLTHDSTLISLADIAALGKPILLNPLYYECPVLCNLVIDGVEKSVHDLDWSPGEEYIIVSFSVDEEEGPSQAAATRERILKALPHPSAVSGWYFLTDPKGDSATPSARTLADAIGFRYKPDPLSGEIIHPAAIAFLSSDPHSGDSDEQSGDPDEQSGATDHTPAGSLTVSRYLYGFSFNPFDMKNALYEAADGKVGTFVEQALLYCYTFDPSTRSYVPVAMNVMKLGGLATVLILGIFFTALWVREKRPKPSETFLLKE